MGALVISSIDDTKGIVLEKALEKKYTEIDLNVSLKNVDDVKHVISVLEKLGKVFVQVEKKQKKNVIDRTHEDIGNVDVVTVNEIAGIIVKDMISTYISLNKKKSEKNLKISDYIEIHKKTVDWLSGVHEFVHLENRKRVTLKLVDVKVKVNSPYVCALLKHFVTMKVYTEIANNEF